MARIARRRIERSHIDVDLRVQTAEELPFEDGSFDCVVSTWTLCSIRDARRAVAEIGRVLKPGGRFRFLEHGLNEEPGVQRRQRRLTPLQKRIAGGCRLDVDIEALVKSGAFRDVRVERFLLEADAEDRGLDVSGDGCEVKHCLVTANADGVCVQIDSPRRQDQSQGRRRELALSSAHLIVSGSFRRPGAEAARVWGDADPTEVQPVGVPAGLDRDVGVCPLVSVTGTGSVQQPECRIR